MIDIQRSTIEKHLNQLQADTRPQWGNMDALQMVNHLLYSVRVGNGEIASPSEPTKEKAQQFQSFLASDHPMPRQYDAKFAQIPIEEPEVDDLEKGKAELLKAIDTFTKKLEENPDEQFMNPEFGLLTLQQWQRLHSKHFAHHLKQFNLI